jgi:hypothetical protein
MKIAFKSCAAALALGLATVSTPVLAQSSVTPKSGPDVNQPKYVPNSDKPMPSSPTTGAGPANNQSITGGPGESGSNSSGNSGGTGASSGSGSGSGTGSGSGSGGSSGSQ